MEEQLTPFSKMAHWLPDRKIISNRRLGIIRNKNKKPLIYHLKELKGGKCEICGYDKNFACLNLHHCKDKKFGFSDKETWNRSTEDIIAEVAKCKLLCGNCHQDLHHPHLRKD